MKKKYSLFWISFAVVFGLLVFGSIYFSWLDLFSRDPTFATTGPAEQFLKCGGRWPPLLKWGAGVGGLFYLLWLFRTVILLNLSLVLLSGAMFKNFKPLKSTFLLLSMIAMQDPPVEVCTVGSCNPSILFMMSSKCVRDHIISGCNSF